MHKRTKRNPSFRFFTLTKSVPNWQLNSLISSRTDFFIHPLWVTYILLMLSTTETRVQTQCNFFSLTYTCSLTLPFYTLQLTQSQKLTKNYTPVITDSLTNSLLSLQINSFTYLLTRSVILAVSLNHLKLVHLFIHHFISAHSVTDTLHLLVLLFWELNFSHGLECSFIQSLTHSYTYNHPLKIPMILTYAPNPRNRVPLTL